MKYSPLMQQRCNGVRPFTSVKFVSTLYVKRMFCTFWTSEFQQASIKAMFRIETSAVAVFQSKSV